MKKILLLIGLIALFCVPTIASAKTSTEWIEYWAKVYGVNPYQMISVAICESELNTNAFNRTDGVGGSRGLFQYQTTTWNMFSQELGEELDIWSAYDQSKLTAYAWSKDRQNHWSCYKSLYKRS